MNWHACDSDFTGGDGSAEYPHDDVPTCGNGLSDDSRIATVKTGLTDAITAYGAADYALMLFHQRAAPFDCPMEFASGPSGGWQGAGASPCGGGFNFGDLVVGFNRENVADLLEYMDRDSNYATLNPPAAPPAGLDIELRGSGITPLEGAQDSAFSYVNQIRTADAVGTCRPYRVVLVTDGEDTCGGTPETAADVLRLAGVPVYVIGFAASDATIIGKQSTRLQLRAEPPARYLSTTQSSCQLPSLRALAIPSWWSPATARTMIATDWRTRTSQIWATPAMTAILESVRARAIGFAMPRKTVLFAIYDCRSAQQTEVCNGVDDNCNGVIDENGGCESCVPTVEVCDSEDNNCDGDIDVDPIDVDQDCGLSLGRCTSGKTKCLANGTQDCDGDTGPFEEVCNGLDDDCDGVTDGMTRGCYTGANATEGVGVCFGGTEACTSVRNSGVEAWGSYVGEMSPGTEICDGLDNDCDTEVDENVSDDFGNETGDSCCRFGGLCGTGVCTAGSYECAGAQVSCVGGAAPSDEICDGLDNDCNGQDDDVAGVAVLCTLPGGCAGSFACTDGQPAPVCVALENPALEVCNGIDDDCDGSIDEEPDISDNDSTMGVVCLPLAALNDQAPYQAGVTA